MARTQVQAELIATNAISGTIIADNAITATHIATNSISGTLVQDSGIVTSMIAANNVTAAKIVSDGVETRHLHSNVISGQSTVTAASGDFVLIGDTSDSNNLKKALVSDFGVSGISSSADATAITINSSEQVGIGVTDPDQALEIGAGGKLKLSRADNARSMLLFTDNNNATIQSDTDPLLLESANIMTFNTSGANERMRIDADGALFLNTTSAMDNCFVSFRDHSNGEAFLGIDAKDDSNVGIRLGHGGTRKWIMYSDPSDNLIWYSNANSAERMRINPDGRLLLGTNTSNYEYGGITQITVNPSSWSSGLGIGTQTNASEGDGCGIDFFQKISLSGAKWNTARIGSHAVSVGSSAYGDIRFSTMNATSFSEKMRIIPTGVLCLGDFTPESGDASTPTSIFLEGGECNMVIKNTDATSSSQRQGIAFLNSSGTRVGTITITTSTTGFTHNSDYRLKENIDYTWDATTRLKQLKPVRFNWIVDDTDTLVDGFLAHEVSNVVPEAVTGEKDGDEMQGIDQSKLIPLLVKTIQELEARIKTLEG